MEEDTNKIHPVNFHLNHLFDEKHQKIYEIQSINYLHNSFEFRDVNDVIITSSTSSSLLSFTDQLP